jgi:hypothetical protein
MSDQEFDAPDGNLATPTEKYITSESPTCNDSLSQQNFFIIEIRQVGVVDSRDELRQFTHVGATRNRVFVWRDLELRPVRFKVNGDYYRLDCGVYRH